MFVRHSKLEEPIHPHKAYLLTRGHDSLIPYFLETLPLLLTNNSMADNHTFYDPIIYEDTTSQYPELSTHHRNEMIITNTEKENDFKS
jgi:hypothetical protein